MKNIKYLIFIVALMFLNINNIYAETCYYQVGGENSLAFDTVTGSFTINDYNGKKIGSWRFVKNNEPLINYDEDFNDTKGTKNTGLTVEAIARGTCPNQIVYRHRSGSDGVFGFNNSSKANEFAQASSQIYDMTATIIDRSYITEEQYNSNLIKNTGKKNSNNKYAGHGLSINGEDTEVDCDALFGSKDDTESIAYLVNEILKYPRFIVPILIILLGSLDFFKAVISSKEDGMKKAQSTFIKRIVIGVAVFLVPVIIDAIMWLADIVWEGLGYTSCGI